jgi:hypothetical protein
MRVWPKSLKGRTILLTLLGLMGVIGTAGYVWWRPIRGYVHNQLQIIRERDSDDPVVRGLARGEIRAGSSLDDLIAAHPPKRVERFGRFADVYFANGVMVIAVDGKLVFAREGWCSHCTVFFNHFTPADSQEYESCSAANHDRQVEEWKNAHGAVGGFAGCVEYWAPLRNLANPDPYTEQPWEAEQADPHRAAGGVIAYMPYCQPFRTAAEAPADDR